jgi:small subunit ribosomal protein S16
MGKKKQPTYRVVAADSRSPRDGRFLEVVGSYAPRGRSSTDSDAVITIDHDKALKWLRDGAKPTDRVERILRSAGTLDRLAGAPAPEAATETPAAAQEPAAEEASAEEQADGAAEEAGE